MKLWVRTALFGAGSGLLWSAAPIWFSNRSFDTIKVFPFVAIITGILISFALYKPLLKFKRWGVLFLGIIALPLGAFCFGAGLGLFESAAGYASGGGISPSHNPLAAVYFGFTYACMTLAIGCLSYYGLLLFPLAVLTTCLLRLVITPKSSPAVPGSLCS